MEIYSVFLGGLIGVAPSLLFWIAVIVVATIILRRGRGRAERFIIAGAGLKISSNLLNIIALAVVPWLVQEGTSVSRAASLASAYESCAVLSVRQALFVSSTPSG